MKQDKMLQVCYGERNVGTLAVTADHKVAFQYDEEWLEHGFAISPFSLFETKRFDRVQTAQGEKRVHMITAAALLEQDFEQPSLDYHSLMKLTKILTRDNPQDLENMYRRMCFNVFAHNRDDHSKNFTYLYEEEKDEWHLSPAYDLTYSNTYYGEHTTTVDGNGKNPGEKELLAVGTAAGMKKDTCRDIMEEIKQCVNEMLAEYLFA